MEYDPHPRFEVGIFDVSFLVNRIFFAQSHNESTTVANVFKASLRAIKGIRSQFGLSRLYFCFDAPNNFRKGIYPKYKGQREEKDPILEESLIELYDFLYNGLGFNCFKQEGYEADDFIASIRNQISSNVNTLIISGDKDLLQLASPTCNLIIGTGKTRFELMNEAYVMNKFGIDSKHVSTYLALVGDSADNFPGIEGCGEKKAIKLIEEYETYENIINNVDNIKDKRIKAGINKLEDPLLPQKLANLVYDIDLSFITPQKDAQLKQIYMQKYNLNY